MAYISIYINRIFDNSFFSFEQALYFNGYIHAIKTDDISEVIEFAKKEEVQDIRVICGNISKQDNGCLIFHIYDYDVTTIKERIMNYLQIYKHKCLRRHYASIIYYLLHDIQPEENDCNMKIQNKDYILLCDNIEFDRFVIC